MLEETLSQWYQSLSSGNALGSIIGIIVIYVKPWMLEDTFAAGCDDYIGMGADTGGLCAGKSTALSWSELPTAYGLRH